MKRGNFIVSKSEHNMKIKAKALKVGFAKPAKHSTESEHLDSFPFPQIWLLKHKVNQGASRHENITESQIVR